MKRIVLYLTVLACFVCSDQKDNMMAFYTNRDSVGIIHWNNMYVTDTEVRAYDDRGNELFCPV